MPVTIRSASGLLGPCEFLEKHFKLSRLDDKYIKTQLEIISNTYNTDVNFKPLDNIDELIDFGWNDIKGSF